MKAPAQQPGRALLILITTALMLSACTSNLWGDLDDYQTPSPQVVATETHSPLAATATALAEMTRSTDAQPTLESTPLPTRIVLQSPQPTLLYSAQSGDSLQVVAVHFGVEEQEITSAVPLPAVGFIDPGTPLLIPNRLEGTPTTPDVHLLPDSEVVFSPSAVDFDISEFVDNAAGTLADYTEWLAISGRTTGAGSVQRLSFESSINPRILLAFVQYKAGWVEGQAFSGVDPDYPLDYGDLRYRGLYQQMRLLVQELDAGYYGWRAGTLQELTFTDGSTLRIAPSLNAGTVALQYVLSRQLDRAGWLAAVDPETGFMGVYKQLFGDPWVRAALVEPLFPPGLIQPNFSLPFDTGVLWSLTGGPHAAWEQESALSALDFAPGMDEPGCGESDAWVVAIAPGLIVRSSGGYVILDLDGDGHEGTGWVVLYMHMATKDRIPAGTWVDAGDRLGHPSCEGGMATGTHLHIARKYNGEWVGAGGALPFVLSGWTAHQGDAPYYGWLTRGDETITSSKAATFESHIIRQPGE